jgi:hypothetical protein
MIRVSVLVSVMFEETMLLCRTGEADSFHLGAKMRLENRDSEWTFLGFLGFFSELLGFRYQSCHPICPQSVQLGFVVVEE